MKKSIKSASAWQIAALLGLLISQTACRRRDESVVQSFLSRPASGVVDGRAWEVKHAYLDPTITTPNEEDYVIVLLPYKPKTPCPSADVKAADSRAVMVSAPKNTKLTKLKRGSPRNAVFQYMHKSGAVAVVALTGRLQYSKISSTSLQGRVVARFGNDNWINGDFTAVGCVVGDLQAPRTL